MHKTNVTWGRETSTTHQYVHQYIVSLWDRPEAPFSKPVRLSQTGEGNTVAVSFSLSGARPTDPRFWGAGAKSGPGPVTVGLCTQGGSTVSLEMISVNHAFLGQHGVIRIIVNLPMHTCSSVVWISATGENTYRSVRGHWWASASNSRHASVL